MESTAAETFGELLNHSPEPPFSQPTPLGFCMRDSRSDYVAEEEGGQAKVRIAFDIDEDRVYPLVGEVAQRHYRRERLLPVVPNPAGREGAGGGDRLHH